MATTTSRRTYPLLMITSHVPEEDIYELLFIPLLQPFRRSLPNSLLPQTDPTPMYSSLPAKHTSQFQG